MWQIEPKYLQSDETIEYVDRPSMLSCMFAYIWTGLWVTVFTTAFIAMLALGTDSANSGVRTFMLAPMTFYALLASPGVYVILRRLSTRYAVSTRGLITRTGILTTSMKSVPFKHVTSIEVRESLFGRLFHYAHLFIDTSGSGSAIECRWKYVIAAHRVKKLIEGHLGVGAPAGIKA